MKVAVAQYLFPFYLSLARSTVEGRFEDVDDVASFSASSDESLSMGGMTGECDTEDGTCGDPPAEFETMFHGHNEEGCMDTLEDCDPDYCVRSFSWMRDECRETCLLCGNVGANSIWNLYSEEAQVYQSMEELEYSKRVDEYMYNDVYLNETYNGVRNDCKNRDELCLFWASIGECENNPKYMNKQCAPSCFSCNAVSFEMRCPHDKRAPKAWSKAGDLDAMFTRIVTEPEFQKNYNITILSEPDPDLHKNVNNNNNNGQEILEGPWVVVVDDFLTPEECDTLRDLGALEGYERSEDVGERNFDGSFGSIQSEGRTSSNAWCVGSCWEHNVSKTVHDRMHRLLQIPIENYEFLQLLKYEVGQFYETHHDYIPHHLDRPQGVRILTVFMYLNDVEEGGGTNFPELDLTVQPRKGRALLWPSVLDEDPNERDDRTDHQALPVISGIKYGANAWVHQRDFKEPYHNDCI